MVMVIFFTRVTFFWKVMDHNNLWYANVKNILTVTESAPFSNNRDHKFMNHVCKHFPILFESLKLDFLFCSSLLPLGCFQIANVSQKGFSLCCNHSIFSEMAQFFGRDLRYDWPKTYQNNNNKVIWDTFAILPHPSCQCVECWVGAPPGHWDPIHLVPNLFLPGDSWGAENSHIYGSPQVSPGTRADHCRPSGWRGKFSTGWDGSGADLGPDSSAVAAGSEGRLQEGLA